MNVVSIIGRITKDPEVRYTTSRMAVLRFTVAVDRNMTREKREAAMNAGTPTADFIGCMAFGNTAETIGKYFTKGKKIGLVGHIQTGKYENQNGQTIYTTDVIVDRFDFVESANQQQNYQRQNDYPQGGYAQPQGGYQQRNVQNNQPMTNQQVSMDDEIPSEFMEINEDDIPF